MKKLAIIISHPIQYYAPTFQMLAKHCDLKVFYTIGNTNSALYDAGFKRTIQWDIPLLEGYKYEFVENTAKKPNSNHFNGINNPKLINRVSAFNPDKILVYGWAHKSHFQLMRYFKGKIEIWFRGDSTLLDEGAGLKNIMRKIFLTYLYKHIDYAFYTGIANKAYFKKFGIKEKQLVFLPHAIDNQRFAENRSIESSVLRNQLNIKPNEILILFAGKLEEKKDPKLLLEAFLKLDNKNTHLLFVGNGELESDLKFMVASAKTETDQNTAASRIQFMNFQNQSQMPVIYQACDLFCLPSQGPNETWGLAVNEAMAAGKATLVSDKVGCAANLVKENTNGYIFENRNIKSLIANLASATASKQNLKEMGVNSSNVINGYSFQQQVYTIIKRL